MGTRWYLTAALAAAASLVACGGGDQMDTASPMRLTQSADIAAAAGPATEAAAIRFLEQATFGPTPADVAHLQSIGYDAWLNEQFAMRPTALGKANSFEAVQAGFFRNALTARDQLRQRVAFALGQVMVVSNQKLDNTLAIANYHNLLLNDAFANYRQLLKDVTLSPTMGTYLDMANNVKSDPETGTAPNENYAREVLQLFSVGLYKLNPDGSTIVDGSGNPVATYSQETVEGFAHVFTGWTYPGGKRGATGLNGPAYTGAMVFRAGYHETGTKELLDGATVSADGVSELESAMDSIANHPNVGPFVGTRLIQALVKSNPSPPYVQRVAAAFANNGSGVRGDMRAVIRAVLLDTEARTGDTQAAGASDGKLREPVLYMTRLLRAFPMKSTGAGLPRYAEEMRQDVFASPSVFNFYPPSYKPQGYTIYGPEFKILNSPSLAGRLNFAYDFANGGLPGKAQPDLRTLAAAASDDALISLLDAKLLHGTMPASLRTSITNALVASNGDAGDRARLALYLVAASPAFNIQR